MLDDRTPHVAVVVQAVNPSPDGGGEPVVAATVLSDESGRYLFANLKPGLYQVRCQIPGGYVYYGEKASAAKGAILRIEQGKTLKNIDFRFPPIKKGSWRHYTSHDGLAHNTANKIHIDPDGFMWIGTDASRISRFDGKEFVNFGTEDGLPPETAIFAIHGDTDGVMWLGAFFRGVYRYDGKRFDKFTTDDGLADNFVTTIKSDRDGIIWFGKGDPFVDSEGVSRYDTRTGEFLKPLTTQDGLASNQVYFMLSLI